MRTILPLVIALAGGSLFLAGCTEETDVVYTERPAMYGTTADVDFYYVGEAPYSRQYGMLYYRDNGYYYRHNNSYLTYDRPVLNRTDYYTRTSINNDRERRGQWDERYVRWDQERERMNASRRSRTDWQPVADERRNEQKSRTRGTNQRSDDEVQQSIERRKTAAN